MEHIWLLIVSFFCLFSFSCLMLWTNKETPSHVFARRFTWYMLWLSILVMLAQLAYIGALVIEEIE